MSVETQPVTLEQVEKTLYRLCTLPTFGGQYQRIKSRWVTTVACPAGYPDQKRVTRLLQQLKKTGIAEQLPGHSRSDRAYSLWWHTSVPKAN